MTDAQKVEALHSLISDVLHAYDMTIYDMEDPQARSLVNKWSDIYFNQMLSILNDNKGN